jgi:hypothetical protein
MLIRRAVIVRAILALGAAGSILAGSVASVAMAQAPSAYVVAAAPSATTHTHYVE